LRTWDKPAAACLASRVAYGLPIDRRRLARIEHAEQGIREALAAQAIPVRDLRVRDLGDRARIELDAVALPHLTARPELFEPALRAAGFGAWQVDPRGFRSGSMNDLP
jgi:uncharacterized protein